MTHKLEHKLEHNGFKPEQVTFFKTIKESKRTKIYISNQAMIDAVFDVLNLSYGIPIPEVNSYLHKDTIMKNVGDIMCDKETKNFKICDFVDSKNLIFLFSGGMFAKVLIAELSKIYPNNTYIDIGSTFDGLIKGSRIFNNSKEYRDEMMKIYKNK